MTITFYPLCQLQLYHVSSTDKSIKSQLHKLQGTKQFADTFTFTNSEN